MIVSSQSKVNEQPGIYGSGTLNVVSASEMNSKKHWLVDMQMTIGVMK